MLGIADLKEILITIENGDVRLLFQMLVLVLILYVICKWPKFRHLRYRFRSITLVVLSIFIAVLWPSKLTTYSFFIAFILVLLLGILMYCSSRKILWPSSMLLGKAKEDINKGNYVIAERRLSGYRCFLLDSLEKFEWCLLYAKTFSMRGEEQRAYEILCEIKTDHLLQGKLHSELHKLTIYKAFSIAYMGDIKGATEILPDIATENTDLFLQRALIMAFCEEHRGKLSDASGILLSAINRNPNFLKSKVIPQAYNNLGRIRKMERNVTDTFLYYEKAVQAAIQMRNKGVLYVAMENLILCNALEKNLPSAKLWIGRYNSYIDHIAPIGGAEAVFLNVTPAYINGVAYDGGTYRTVGASFEFGGLVDATVPSTKGHLLMKILEFFDMDHLIILFEDDFESGDLSGWSTATP